jgi:MFS family permease
MVRAYPAVLALTSGGIMLAYVLFYTITTFSLAYGTTKLGLSRSAMLYCAMISVAVMGISVPIFAALSALWAFPLFWLFDTGNPVLKVLAFTVGMVIFAMLYGPMGASLPELYGTRLRYSGASVSYNLGGVLGGAVAPLAATQLLASTGASWSISLYVLAMSAVSFACVFLLSETYLTDLSGIRSEERRLLAERGTPAPGAGSSP